jgi:hypothetical protein
MSAGVTPGNLVASSAITKFRILALDTSDERLVEHAVLAATRPIGVSEVDVPEGEAVTFEGRDGYVTAVEAGEAIAVGDDVVAGLLGKGFVGGSGDEAIGTALTSASADGEIVNLLIAKRVIP